MKKTLIALAVVASAISGSAMADSGWQALPGAINIGGQLITPTPSWEWKVGDGLSSFSTRLDMTSGTSVNIPIESDTMFLSAKMTRETTSGFVGNSLIPKVELKSYDGAAITPQFVDGENMTLSVKVKDVDSQEGLGTISIPVNYGAAVAMNIKGNQADSSVTNMISGAPGTILEGLVKPGRMTNASVALKWSGVSLDELRNAVQSIDPGNTINLVSGQYDNFNDATNSNYVSVGDRAIIMAYGSGILNGQSLTMNLNAAVSKTTNWVAPVEVVVTYS